MLQARKMKVEASASSRFPACLGFLVVVVVMLKTSLPHREYSAETGVKNNCGKIWPVLVTSRFHEMDGNATVIIRYGFEMETQPPFTEVMLSSHSVHITIDF